MEEKECRPTCIRISYIIYNIIQRDGGGGCLPIKDVVSDYATIWFYVYMYGLHFCFQFMQGCVKNLPLTI